MATILTPRSTASWRSCSSLGEDVPTFCAMWKMQSVFWKSDRTAVPTDAPPAGPPRTAASVLDPPGTGLRDRSTDTGRAVATLARAEAGIAELGRRCDFLVVYY